MPITPFASSPGEPQCLREGVLEYTAMIFKFNPKASLSGRLVLGTAARNKPWEPVPDPLQDLALLDAADLGLMRLVLLAAAAAAMVTTAAVLH